MSSLTMVPAASLNLVLVSIPPLQPPASLRHTDQVPTSGRVLELHLGLLLAFRPRPASQRTPCQRRRAVAIEVL